MTGTNLALVVWGSFPWVSDRSELAVTKYSSLCAIWSPMKWMFWGNVVLLPVASLVRVWVRVFDHPEDEMANSLLPQFLLPPSCRRDKCPWVVCFWSSYPKWSVQERAHGEVDRFCTKPSTVWREQQRSVLSGDSSQLQLSVARYHCDFIPAENPAVPRQSCYLHQWKEQLIFQWERKTDLPWLQKLQIPVRI